MKTSRRGRTTAIDWEHLHERLVTAEARNGQALCPSEKKELLDRRAQALAQRPVESSDAGHVLELLSFALANERYAIETRYVQRVVPLGNLTPMPGTPDFFVGITSLHGQVLAVVDLFNFFGLAARGLADPGKLIVLGRRTPELAVLAESAESVLRISMGELLPAPESLSSIDRANLRGVTKEALVVLDGAALLDDARLFVHHGPDPAGAGQTANHRSGDRG